MDGSVTRSPGCACCNGRTPLHAACLSLSPAVVVALLRAGADPENTDGEGQPALHVAVRAAAEAGEATEGRELVQVRVCGCPRGRRSALSPRSLASCPKPLHTELLTGTPPPLPPLHHRIRNVPSPQPLPPLRTTHALTRPPLPHLRRCSAAAPAPPPTTHALLLSHEPQPPPRPPTPFPHPMPPLSPGTAPPRRQPKRHRPQRHDTSRRRRRHGRSTQPRGPPSRDGKGGGSRGLGSMRGHDARRRDAAGAGGRV